LHSCRILVPYVNQLLPTFTHAIHVWARKTPACLMHRSLCHWAWPWTCHTSYEGLQAPVGIRPQGECGHSRRCRRSCHSSRASSELCLSVSDGQTRLPNSLSVLFTLFFSNVGSNSAANRAGAAYNLGGGWSIHLYNCGSKQQDAVTADIKGSQ
jgi:hypothetical protein